MLPSKLQILGRKYKLKKNAERLQEYSEQGGETWGVTLPLSAEIILNPDMPLDHEQSVVLHEIFHALHVTEAASMHEDTVAAMSYGLYRVLRDNPRLVEYLTS